MEKKIPTRKFAALCVSFSSKNTKRIAFAIMRMTEACCRKGAIPIGCIDLHRGGKEIFEALNDLKDKKISFDYLVIWSKAQIGITVMEEFVLRDKLKTEFDGAKLIILKEPSPPKVGAPKS